MDLWSKNSLKYSVEHARAKLAMLGGAATREEEERQVKDDGSENPDNLVLMIIMLNEHCSWYSPDLHRL